MLNQKWLGVLAVLILLLGITVWGYAQTVTEDSVETNLSDQHETTIAVDPLNNLIFMAGWNDFRADADGIAFHPGYAFSVDGGSSWSTGILNGVRDATLPNHTGGFDPAVAIDRNGTAYYCYVLSPGEQPGVPAPLGPIFISKTTNQGQSWSHSQVSSLFIEDKPYMAVDNTGITNPPNIYVTWTRFDSTLSVSEIRFARSTDGGTSFRDEQRLASRIIPLGNPLIRKI